MFFSIALVDLHFGCLLVLVFLLIVLQSLPSLAHGLAFVLCEPCQPGLPMFYSCWSYFYLVAVVLFVAILIWDHWQASYEMAKHFIFHWMLIILCLLCKYLDMFFTFNIIIVSSISSVLLIELTTHLYSTYVPINKSFTSLESES